jgi:hypothetical protein
VPLKDQPPPPSPGVSGSIGSRQSPQNNETSGLAEVFRPQPGQVYFVLLTAFFLRFGSASVAGTVVIEHDASAGGQEDGSVDETRLLADRRVGDCMILNRHDVR